MALNSKRMQTFFNEFLISTTNFLNQFMTDCETKFFEFERKLNRIESNLVIVEAKLASVPLETDNQPQPTAEIIPKPPEPPSDSLPIPSQSPSETVPSVDVPDFQPQSAENKNFIKISESFLYKKYFKMLKFGVPEAGVRNKMASEGLDGSLIADPNLMIEKCPEDFDVVEE